MRNYSIKSHAKINLSLNVISSRDDKYHELDSIMLPLEFHDSILLTKLKRAVDNCVTIDDFTVDTFNHNLATFAIEKMADIYKFDTKFRIFIHKIIPLQAGLGGGSSNAAFTMIGVNKMLNLNLSKEELQHLGLSLGADVPFFFDNVPARINGIGEIIKPINIKKTYFVLLVKPSKGCSTKEVFAKYDASKNKTKPANIDNVIKALEEGDDDLLASSIGNSLESVAMELVPEIKEIKEYLISKGLKIVLMSGTGSTVFALSNDKALLKKIYSELEDKYFVELTMVKK